MHLLFRICSSPSILHCTWGSGGTRWMISSVITSSYVAYKRSVSLEVFQNFHFLHENILLSVLECSASAHTLAEWSGAWLLDPCRSFPCGFLLRPLVKYYMLASPLYLQPREASSPSCSDFLNKFLCCQGTFSVEHPHLLCGMCHHIRYWICRSQSS